MKTRLNEQPRSAYCRFANLSKTAIQALENTECNLLLKLMKTLIKSLSSVETADINGLRDEQNTLDQNFRKYRPYSPLEKIPLSARRALQNPSPEPIMQ